MHTVVLVVLILLLAAAVYSLAQRDDLRVPLWCVVLFLVIFLLHTTGVIQ